MNDMKKLSMLAAGVAVLSLCACTEANEFTPSTNNSTKKITEIKVSANPSALGSRTDFTIEYDNYGAPTANYGKVKWVSTDQLYFFKEGTNSNPQIFNCGADDKTQYSEEPQSQYDWNYFKVDEKSKGLDVGENYYAYFFPDKLKQETESCETFIVNNHLRFAAGGYTNANSVLHTFMSDYDLLMSSDPRATADMKTEPTPVPVLAQKDMEAIYMDHAFALVAVDLKCNGMGNYSDYHEMPYYSSAHLHAYSDDAMEKYCFAKKYVIDSDGVLTFSNPNYIASNFDFRSYYYLTFEGFDKEFTKPLDVEEVHRKVPNYSFYFLVHPTASVKKLAIKVYTHSRTLAEPYHAEDITKSVYLTFPESVNFVPGNCYHFGLNVNYDPDKEFEGKDFNYLTHWKSNHKTITLASYPTGMKPSVIKYDNQ